MDGPVRRTSTVRSRSVGKRVIARLVGIVAVTVVGMATASAADASTAVTGLSAARALADAPLLADAMNRTVAAGWGTAETGGAYSYDDQNAFTVNGSQGVITLPGPAESRTVSTAVSATDQTAKTDLGVNSLPTSGRGISVRE